MRTPAATAAAVVKHAGAARAPERGVAAGRHVHAATHGAGATVEGRGKAQHGGPSRADHCQTHLSGRTRMKKISIGFAAFLLATTALAQRPSDPALLIPETAPELEYTFAANAVT